MSVTSGEIAGQARDQDLLAAIAAGDEAAFEVFVAAHERRVLRLCERFLGDPEAARDAAQEVFLKVLRHAHRFEPRARVTTWLHRLTVNHCLNQLRRRKVVRMLSLGSLGGGGEDAEEWDPPAPDADPERALLARRRWRATRRAIDALPANQRAVLVLAKFEGLSYQEIADTLGITVSAVESRLFRAMRNLEKAQGEGPAGVP